MFCVPVDLGGFQFVRSTILHEFLGSWIFSFFSVALSFDVFVLRVIIRRLEKKIQFVSLLPAAAEQC